MLNKRILFSSIISIAIIVYAVIFLKPKRHKNKVSSEKPIAKVVKQENYTQIKPKGKKFWNDIQYNFDIKEGDYLRTGPNSFMEILFLASKEKLSLGPETTIFAQINKEILELDLQEGSIFLDNKLAKTKMLLKVKDKQFEVGKAKINLGFAQNNSVELEVFDGSINLGGKKVIKGQRLVDSPNGSTIQKNFFNFIKPEIGKNISIPPNNNIVEFKWIPHKNSYNYKFFVGRSKSNLKEIPVISQSNESLKVKILPGLLYWQIRARNNVFSFESPVIHSLFSKVSIPEILTPIDGDIYVDNGSNKIDMTWNLKGAKSNVILEVARTKDFAKVIETFSLTGDISSIDLSKKYKEGTYSLRIRGFFNEQFDELISDIVSIKILKKDKILKPELISPKNKLTLYTSESENILLVWNNLPNINKYKVEIYSKNGYEQSLITSQSRLRLGDLGAGEYYWNVTAIGQGQEVKSSKRIFEIKKLPIIQITNTPNIIYYNGLETLLNLQWNKVNQTDKYSIEISNTLNETQDFDSINNFININLSEIGNYKIRISALLKNKIVAKSKPFSIKVIEHPRLSSPEINLDLTATHKSDGKGNFQFTFNKVQDAHQYIIEVRANDARILKSWPSKDNVAEIKDLLPGVNYIYVRSLDKFKRKSKLGIPVKIEVPNISDLEKPKIKKINIR